MTFIEIISDENAPPETKRMYQQYEESLGYIPNYAKVFSHRPQVMDGWRNLLGSIVGNVDKRRYELVTLAAARALSSSYCMLAHGSILSKEIFSPDQTMQIANDYHQSVLSPAEVAMMEFAEQVVRDATAITQKDVENLRDHGFSDAEIFDITTIATARCFFSKTLDALGAEPDEVYLELEENLRKTLTVGRSISGHND
jgi:uncharacterized peroxidase-related enzyme